MSASGLETTGKTEIAIVGLNLIRRTDTIKKTDVEELKRNEDAIFTSFLRHIENNNAFLSVSIFEFIHSCSKYVKGWPMKIKRIAIDSQLAVLIAHVLSQSAHRSATRSALAALQFFMGLKEKEFVEVFVSAFTLVGQKARDKGLEIKRDQLFSHRLIDKLEFAAQNRETETETPVPVHHTRGHEEEEREKQSTAEIELEARNAALAAQNKAQKDFVRQLEEQNRVLEERLSQMEKSQREYAEYMDKHVKQRLEDMTQQSFALREAEERLETAKRETMVQNDQVAKLERDLKSADMTKGRLEKDLERAASQVKSEQERSSGLEHDIERLEKENEKFRRIQKDINHVKRKYALKKKAVQDQMAELDKEKRKWESIAKFTATVRKHKFEAAQDVYDIVY
jgi:hypothetical protein